FNSFSDASFTDNTGSPDTYFSYLACVYDAQSRLLSTKYFANIKAKGSSALDHLVFTTSSYYDGNLGGIAGADNKCATRAAAAGLVGQWKAVISDGSKNASEHISVIGKVFNMNGQLLANDKVELLTTVL